MSHLNKHNKKFQLTAGSAVFSRGYFISKLSVFAEFIVHLPAATEFGVRLLRGSNGRIN